MKLSARISATAALLVLLLSATGCNRLKSRDQINKGVQAFKNAQYEAATGHFQQAIELDPSSASAKLYLATAYSYQVVPNLDTPDNLKLANKAIDGFKEVLSENPNDITALKQLASIYRNIKKFPEAKEYETKVIAADPNDAEANYTIGVIDWAEAYKNATTLLAANGQQDNGEGNAKLAKDACKKLQAQNSPLIEDGLTHLNRAVEINTTYDDAMQYLNLIYRRRADLACGDENARKADLAKAQEWSDKAMGARKINEKIKEDKATRGTVTQ